MARARRNRWINKKLVSTIAVHTLVVIFLFVIYLWADTVEATATAKGNDNGNDPTVSVHTHTSHPVVSTHVVPINKSATASDYILFPWFVQLVGCITLFLLTKYNAPLPHEAVMFLFGALLGAYSTNATDETHSLLYFPKLHNSISEWINIDSELLLIVFLPGLLFKEAVELPINLLLVALGQIFIMAFPMVLVGTALTAIAGYYVLPYEAEFPEVFGIWAWISLGAILASTDPIAVSAVLKTAGASPRLNMHFAGESIFNDGSSYVFFTIASNLWFKGIGIDQEVDISGWGKGLLFFFQMSVGGVVVGALFGVALIFLLHELDRKMERQFDILQVVLSLTTAYLCFFFCDQNLDVSGIMAVATCGLVVNRFGKGMVNDEELMHSYMVLAEYLLNTLLFALGGLLWGAISFENKKDDHPMIKGDDYGWLLVFYGLMVVIRFFQVGLFYPLYSRIGLHSNPKEATFFAFAGLHGSVGVALGLSLVQAIFKEVTDVEDPRRHAATILQFLGGGGTLLTLLINGTSAEFVLKKLGLATPPIPTAHAKHIFEGTAKDFVFNELVNLFQEPLFQNVSYSILHELVPFCVKEPPRTKERNHTHHNITSVQRFTQKIAGGGKPYMSLVRAATNASSRVAAYSEKWKTELVIEIRQVYLEVLREAYKQCLDTLELDNDYLYESLIESVDLALNEVRYDHKPIGDWHHLEVFFGWNTAKKRRKSSTRSSSLRSSFAKSKGAYAYPSELMSLTSCDYNAAAEDAAAMTICEAKAELSVKRLRLDVLRSIAFKRGHMMAESKLRLYVNRFDDKEDESMQAQHKITTTALEQVLQESRDQIRFADALLDEDEVSSDDLEIILSHYCARIVIRRLSKFTELKAEEGILVKKEARKYFCSLTKKAGQIDAITVARLAELRKKSDWPDCDDNEDSLQLSHLDGLHVAMQAIGETNNGDGKPLGSSIVTDGSSKRRISVL